MTEDRRRSEDPTLLDPRSGRPATGPTTQPAQAGDPGGIARYEVGGELGRGGMGRVVLADDRRLGRRVAIKMPLEHVDEGSLARFLGEARATAQLEHPSIVPLYDLDVAADGGGFFTMRFVTGRSLSEVLSGLREDEPGVRDTFPPAELLLVFTKVCDAVAYAHGRGVLHRDLKPDNIMLGRFGEVFVMDWGLAKDVAAAGPEEPADDAASEPAVDSGDRALTEIGHILGTPGYMAPEQARGHHAAVDHRSDVFALGAILYEMLTWLPAIRGEGTLERIANTIVSDPEPPRSRAPERGIGRGLEDIVLRAMARSPADRFESVRELRDAVAAELEGSRERAQRRESARRRVAAAETQLREHEARIEEHGHGIEEIRGRRRVLGCSVGELDALRSVWRAEQELEDLAVTAERAFWDAYGALLGAADDDPDGDAPERLVQMLVARADSLQRDGDAAGARQLLAIARQHDPERVQALRDVPARVTFDLPAGGTVRVARFQRQGPIRVESVVEEGLGPSATVELAPGSYVADFQKGGGPSLRRPFVARSGVELTVDLPDVVAGAVPASFAVVPAGRWAVGGDPHGIPLRPRRTVDLQAFLLCRTLVTVAEYAEFLNDLVGRDPGLAEAHAPRVGDTVYWRPGSDGRYAVPWTDTDGDVLPGDTPIFMIGPTAADAYVKWRALYSGLPLRLPTSDEWEVAARGADDRVYPWGDGFDPALCWMADTFAGARLGPRPVATRPLDRSVFGILDMAGLVREITSSTMGPQRVARGGAWHSSAVECRIGKLTLLDETQSFISYGIRLACDVRILEPRHGS